MMHVMKRRKVDASPPTIPMSQALGRHNVMQQQRDAVPSGRGDAASHSRQYQRGLQSRVQDRYHQFADNTRQHRQPMNEYHHQQQPGSHGPFQNQTQSQQMWAQFPTTSSSGCCSSSCPPPVVTTTAPTSSPMHSRSMVSESPHSLPGISTMLRMPSPGAQMSSQNQPVKISVNGNGGSTRERSLSMHSPTMMMTHQQNGSNSMFSLPYRWTPNMTSISPTKAMTSRPVVSVSSSNSSSLPQSPVSSNSDHDDNSSQKSSAATPVATTVNAPGERIANPNKNSRYLREMDRREILARIEQGEKQATLAKEYQVSRAAICNLNKHREDVMLRKDENPLAKHPKKPRPKSLKVKTSSNSASRSVNRKLPSPRMPRSCNGGKNIHEVQSRAAALLLTSLRNKNTPMGEFRRSSERLVRLMLEEALALVPIKAVEVLLTDSVKADGVGWEHPPCAISMESHDQANSGSPLLDLFRVIEPDQPTARANISNEQNQDDSTAEGSKAHQVAFGDTCLFPASLKYQNVFLLDVSAASADAICAVVQALQERGAVEAMIYLVVLFIDSETVASIHKKYPSVEIVAAQIDRTPAPSAPETENEEGGASATTASDAESTSSVSQPSRCSELVLSRLRQVYSSPPTAAVEEASC